MKRLVSLSLLGLLSMVACCEAQDWPRFRGPNGSGVSDATTIPVQWTDKDYNWKVELPGQGYGSPVTWKGNVFVTSADVEIGKRFLVCLDGKNGQERWRREFPFTKYKKHKQNSFASATPAVDADHVYVIWQSQQQSALTACNHDGKTIWSYELGPFKSGQGSATSPIVYQDLVIVCNDQDGDSFLVAVNRQTGKEAWKVARDGSRACFSTPCVYSPQDRPVEIIFTHSFQGITSIDPASGKENWNIKPFGTFKQRACGSPIVIGDLVIGSSGFTTAEKNVVAVRPVASGSGVEAQEVYRVSKTAPHVPTPLVFDRWMFLWTDRGIVSCVDHQTGKLIWQKRVGGNYFSSPICINGKLYNVDRDGEVVVVAASDQYQLLGRSQLNETILSTFAVGNGALYMRTEAHLISLGGK
jgi:outer membrane protein assembly factor BamB